MPGGPFQRLDEEVEGTLVPASISPETSVVAVEKTVPAAPVRPRRSGVVVPGILPSRTAPPGLGVLFLTEGREEGPEVGRRPQCGGAGFVVPAPVGGPVPREPLTVASPLVSLPGTGSGRRGSILCLAPVSALVR